MATLGLLRNPGENWTLLDRQGVSLVQFKGVEQIFETGAHMKTAIKIPLVVGEQAAAVLDSQSRITNWEPVIGFQQAPFDVRCPGPPPGQQGGRAVHRHLPSLSR